MSAGENAWLADHPATAATLVATTAAYFAVATRCFFAMPAAVAGIVFACVIVAWTAA